MGSNLGILDVLNEFQWRHSHLFSLIFPEKRLLPMDNVKTTKFSGSVLPKYTLKICKIISDDKTRLYKQLGISI